MLSIKLLGLNDLGAVNPSCDMRGPDFSTSPVFWAV
jgi:hypothetical protein